jgi:DNA-3-methyladenine glycosylase
MGSGRTLPTSFYLRPPERVARDLLGRHLVRTTEEGRQVVRIVEVEAYLGAIDAAAHTYGGRRTERVRSMYLGGGHAYVFSIYGMHSCFNVVCGEIGSGTAVLVRAGEALSGLSILRARRGLRGRLRPEQLAGGPARLCQALAIDRALDGVSLLRGPLRIAEGVPVADGEVAVGPRVGVDYAGDAAAWPLRFAVLGSPAVSRPRPF